MVKRRRCAYIEEDSGECITRKMVEDEYDRLVRKYARKNLRLNKKAIVRQVIEDDQSPQIYLEFAVGRILEDWGVDLQGLLD